MFKLVIKRQKILITSAGSLFNNSKLTILQVSYLLNILYKTIARIKNKKINYSDKSIYTHCGADAFIKL